MRKEIIAPMFKAKVIHNRRFYILSQVALWIAVPLTTLYCFPEFLLFDFIDKAENPVSYKLLILGTVLFVLLATLIISLKVKSDKLVGKQKIVIQLDSITITSKKGKKEKSFPIDDITEITAPFTFNPEGWTLRDLWKHLNGQRRKNFIAFQTQEASFHYNFIIDSSYMGVQLEKILVSWEKEGIPITRLQPEDTNNYFSFFRETSASRSPSN